MGRGRRGWTSSAMDDGQKKVMVNRWVTLKQQVIPSARPVLLLAWQRTQAEIVPIFSGRSHSAAREPKDFPVCALALSIIASTVGHDDGSPSTWSLAIPPTASHVTRKIYHVAVTQLRNWGKQVIGRELLRVEVHFVSRNEAVDQWTWTNWRIFVDTQ